MRGTFNFTAQRVFRDAYESASESTKHFIVDLEGVEYLDSSALGILVVLRKRAAETKRSVSLVNCQASVLRLFQVAHLDRVFEIDGAES